MTEGAVAMRSMLNSRRSRSWMISRWRRPKNPQRNPKPSAAEVSISKVKLASLRRSLPMAARKSSNCAASTGKRPQKTTGMAGRKPGRGADTGPGVGCVLERRCDQADLAGAELVDGGELRREYADAVDLIGRPAPHHANP